MSQKVQGNPKEGEQMQDPPKKKPPNGQNQQTNLNNGGAPLRQVPQSVTQMFAFRGGTSDGLRSFYHSDHNYEFAPGPSMRHFENIGQPQSQQNGFNNCSSAEIGDNTTSGDIIKKKQQLQQNSSELRKQYSSGKDGFGHFKPQLNSIKSVSPSAINHYSQSSQHMQARPQTNHQGGKPGTIDGIIKVTKELGINQFSEDIIAQLKFSENLVVQHDEFNAHNNGLHSRSSSSSSFNEPTYQESKPLKSSIRQVKNPFCSSNSAFSNINQALVPVQQRSEPNHPMISEYQAGQIQSNHNNYCSNNDQILVEVEPPPKILQIQTSEVRQFLKCRAAGKRIKPQLYPKQEEPQKKFSGNPLNNMRVKDIIDGRIFTSSGRGTIQGMDKNIPIRPVNVLDPNQIIKEAENKNISKQEKILQRQNEEEIDLHLALLQKESIETPASFDQTNCTFEAVCGTGNFFLNDKSINRFNIPLYPSASNFASEIKTESILSANRDNLEDQASSTLDSFAYPIRRAEINDKSLEKTGKIHPKPKPFNSMLIQGQPLNSIVMGKRTVFDINKNKINQDLHKKLKNNSKDFTKNGISDLQIEQSTLGQIISRKNENQQEVVEIGIQDQQEDESQSLSNQLLKNNKAQGPNPQQISTAIKRILKPSSDQQYINDQGQQQKQNSQNPQIVQNFNTICNIYIFNNQNNLNSQNQNEGTQNTNLRQESTGRRHPQWVQNGKPGRNATNSKVFSPLMDKASAAGGTCSQIGQSSQSNFAINHFGTESSFQGSMVNHTTESINAAGFNKSNRKKSDVSGTSGLKYHNDFSSKVGLGTNLKFNTQSSEIQHNNGEIINKNTTMIMDQYRTNDRDVNSTFQSPSVLRRNQINFVPQNQPQSNKQSSAAFQLGGVNQAQSYANQALQLPQQQQQQSHHRRIHSIQNAPPKPEHRSQIATRKDTLNIDTTLQVQPLKMPPANRATSETPKMHRTVQEVNLLTQESIWGYGQTGVAHTSLTHDDHLNHTQQIPGLGSRYSNHHHANMMSTGLPQNNRQQQQFFYRRQSPVMKKIITQQKVMQRLVAQHQNTIVANMQQTTTIQPIGLQQNLSDHNLDYQLDVSASSTNLLNIHE